MSHDLEQGTDENGFFATSFASRQEPAWHGLGTVFPANKTVTTEDMLKLAHLDRWNVRLMDVRVPTGLLGPDGQPLYIDPDNYVTGQRAVVRDNPYVKGQLDVLGWTGDRYTALQNETAFEFGDALLEGGKWETAGAIKQGRKVFGSLKVNRAPKAGRKSSFIIDPKGVADKVDNYLLVVTSHDGTSPLYVANTPVRVVCQNTLNMALKGVKQHFKLRHTASLDEKIALARETLGINVSYFDRMEQFANAAYATTLTDKKFWEIVKGIIPEPAKDSKAAKTKYDNRLALIEAVYRGTADGPDTNSMIAGTAWGGLQSMLDVEDWHRNPRDDAAESVLIGASGLDYAQNTERTKIWNAFAEIVKDF